MWPTPAPKDGPQTCLMLCASDDFDLLADDLVMESAMKIGEMKSKAEIAAMSAEDRFGFFPEDCCLAWGIRSEPQRGIFVNGAFINRKQ